MASGAAAALKMATVTACILLVLLPMAPKPVMGDCHDSCVALCNTFAEDLCKGNANPNLCPEALQAQCKNQAFTVCIVNCDALICTVGTIAPCIA